MGKKKSFHSHKERKDDNVSNTTKPAAASSSSPDTSSSNTTPLLLFSSLLLPLILACVYQNYYYQNWYDCTVDPSTNILQNDHQLLQELVTQHQDTYQAQFLADNTLIQFDDILSADECEQMKDYLETRHFQSSKTLEQNHQHTVNTQMRTSQTAWCTQDCMTHPLVRQLEDKIQELTTIPSQNYEHLQFLKYQDNGKEYYKEHMDHILAQTDTAPGPRVLTFFFYLSDVQVGGETYFPTYDLKVQPKAGRAILWLNTLPTNILERHPHTRHQALPVEQGVKYAGNVWIHLRNYRHAFQRGCHK